MGRTKRDCFREERVERFLGPANIKLKGKPKHDKSKNELYNAPINDPYFDLKVSFRPTKSSSGVKKNMRFSLQPLKKQREKAQDKKLFLKAAQTYYNRDPMNSFNSNEVFSATKVNQTPSIEHPNKKATTRKGDYHSHLRDLSRNYLRHTMFFPEISKKPNPLLQGHGCLSSNPNQTIKEVYNSVLNY